MTYRLPILYNGAKGRLIIGGFNSESVMTCHTGCRLDEG